MNKEDLPQRHCYVDAQEYYLPPPPQQKKKEKELGRRNTFPLSLNAL